MAGQFVKLYASILDSSVWGEDHATVRVWIAMLAMADGDGFVRASKAGLARRACVTADELDAALLVLEGPDADDSSGVGDGERVIRQQGGWFVVNHRRYRDLRTDKQVRDAERAARYRERQRDASRSSQRVAPEAEAEAYTEAEGERDPRARAIAAALRSSSKARVIADPDGFAEEMLGALGPLALNSSGDELAQSVTDALVVAETGIREGALRKLVRGYVRQTAKTPPGEREHRAVVDAEADDPRRRIGCAPCRDAGEVGELVPQGNGSRQCNNCHRITRVRRKAG